MRTIHITGRAASGKTRRAELRYNEYVAQGKSVAFFDDGSTGTRYSDARARTNPDVKIVTEMTNTDLKETHRG